MNNIVLNGETLEIGEKFDTIVIEGFDRLFEPNHMESNLVIGPGSDATLVTLSITQNGEYYASDYSADGFSEVDVSVSPDLEDVEFTQNGVYTSSDHDGYGEVTVNVSGGGSANTDLFSEIKIIDRDIATSGTTAVTDVSTKIFDTPKYGDVFIVAVYHQNEFNINPYPVSNQYWYTTVYHDANTLTVPSGYSGYYTMFTCVYRSTQTSGLNPMFNFNQVSAGVLSYHVYQLRGCEVSLYSSCCWNDDSVTETPTFYYPDKYFMSFFVSNALGNVPEVDESPYDYISDLTAIPGEDTENTQHVYSFINLGTNVKTTKKFSYPNDYTVYFDTLLLDSINNNTNIWQGTKEEFKALSSRNPKTVYVAHTTNANNESHWQMIYQVWVGNTRVFPPVKDGYDFWIQNYDRMSWDTSDLCPSKEWIDTDITLNNSANISRPWQMEFRISDVYQLVSNPDHVLCGVSREFYSPKGFSELYLKNADGTLHLFDRGDGSASSSFDEQISDGSIIDQDCILKRENGVYKFYQNGTLVTTKNASSGLYDHPFGIGTYRSIFHIGLYIDYFGFKWLD